MDAETQVFELIAESWGLPFGPAKVALLEEAVRHADAANDIVLGYTAREALMDAAIFSGRPDILLVAFSWCLAQCDSDPEQFDSHSMLWRYKWVVGNAGQFPEISRPRIEALFADMERRFREAGSTMAAVAMSRRDLMVEFGEAKQAKAAHAEFRKCRRDLLSDCPACVSNENCSYYAFLKQWGRAVQAAEPVLKARLTCAEEPHRILSMVLRPLLHLGRIDEARAYQRQGYRLVSQGSQFVNEHARHLQFLVLAGEPAQAKRVLERHLPMALETVGMEERFHFLLAARLWCARNVSRGKTKLKVRLPKGPPPPNADGSSDIVALGEWFTHEVQSIARRFDARNGTSAYQEKIDELPELLQLAIE